MKWKLNLLYIVVAVLVISSVSALDFDIKVKINDIEIDPYYYGGTYYYTLNHAPEITNIKVLINDKPVTPYRFGAEYNQEFYSRFNFYPDGFYISPVLATTWRLEG